MRIGIRKCVAFFDKTLRIQKFQPEIFSGPVPMESLRNAVLFLVFNLLEAPVFRNLQEPT